MKKSLMLYILFLLILSSCVSTKVGSKNNYDYSNLKINSKYIVKTKDQKVMRQFEFKRETENNIIGIYQNKEIQIGKNNIAKINKFSLGKTVPIVLLSTATIIISIYLQNRTFGDYYK